MLKMTAINPIAKIMFHNTSPYEVEVESVASEPEPEPVSDPTYEIPNST
jgi:hypothetical protein